MSPAIKTALYIVLLPFVFAGLNPLVYEIEMHNLAHVDHQLLLQACRELIANRNTYKNTNPGWFPTPEPKIVVLDQTVAPFGQEIPEIVRKMNCQIFIRENYVTLFVPHASLSRMFFLGFREGAEQFGTFKYIDGLWFWNGHDNTNTNGQPVATAQAMSAFALRGPVFNSAQKAGLTLAFAGCVGWLLSYLFFAVTAFKVSWLWGFSMLLGGIFLTPFFGVYRNEEAKLPYFCLLLSFASVIVGVVTFIAVRT